VKRILVIFLPCLELEVVQELPGFFFLNWKRQEIFGWRKEAYRITSKIFCI